MKIRTVMKKVFKSKKIIAIIAAVLVVTSVGTAVTINSIGAKAASVSLAPTVAVEKQDLRKSISVTGTIASKESYSIAADMSDVEIKKIRVKVGDRVKKGDVIAELDTSTISDSLSDAEENLAVAQEKSNMEIASAKRNYDLAKQGADAAANRAVADWQKAQQDYNEAVNKSNVIASEYSGASAYESTENSNVDDAKKEVEKARKKSRKLDDEIADLEREIEKIDENANRDLYNQKKDELADLQKKSNKLKNKLEDKQSDLSDVQSDQTEAKSKVSEKESEKKTAEEEIKSTKDAALKAQYAVEDAARENQKNLADSEDTVKSSRLSAKTASQEQEREVKKYKKLLEKAVITAPADGVITSVSGKEGMTYKGDEIAVLEDDSAYKVTAVVDQYDISDVAKDMAAEMKTETTGDEIMTGKLSFVSPVPAAVVQTKDDAGSSSSSASTDYPIEVSIDNPSERLRIGMSVKLTIIENEVKDALALPNSAISEDENGNSYVEVYADNSASSNSKDGTAETKKIFVNVGLKTDYYTEVRSDELSEGMQVIDGSAEENATEAADEL